MASSSIPPKAMVLQCFQAFLQTTEWQDRDDLHNFFTQFLDVNTTIHQNIQSFQPILEFFEIYINKYAVPIVGQEELWIPCQYIEDSCLIKKKVGTQFLSCLATFVFLLTVESERSKVSLPYLRIGGVIKDTKESTTSPWDASKKGNILVLTYPGGVMVDAAKSMGDKGAEASFKPVADASEETLTPEVFFEHLSPIVINGEEYLFLHDLEKTFDIHMDECLSILSAIIESFAIDPSSNPLDRSLLPLGESVVDTVELAMVAVIDAPHSSVLEDEFLATRTLLGAQHTPMPVHMDELESVAMAPNSSISLDSKGINNEDDKNQEDADSPKDACSNLIAFNATNTRARKIPIKNEMNTMKKGNLSVNDYTLKIKVMCECLSYIGVVVDDDDKVDACLCGLGNAYKQFKTSFYTRKNIPHFLELSSLLVVEEKSLIDNGAIQIERNSSKQSLYIGSGRRRGHYPQRGGRGNQVQGQ
ncbi:hypothetical protein L7F22_000386 [Adiantum nelumboides]|nr:hypothetical protein [Adiantum nelumboides]